MSSRGMISQQSTRTGEDSHRNKARKGVVSKGTGRVQNGDRIGWNIIFDKVRYPGYKELIYRKKDQKFLATDLTVV
jgi:hypothetical protein